MSSTASLDNSQVIADVLQIRKTFGIARLTNLAVLFISGPDAAKFLQNRLSNDVLALQPGQGQLNAALDRQGKIQGVFGLYRQPDGFTMVISRDEQANCIAQIEKFHIVEQFTTQEITNVVAISLQGPGSEAFVKTIFQPDSSSAFPQKEHAWCAGQLAGQPCRLIQRSFSGETGYLLLVETDDAEGIWTVANQNAVEAGGIDMSEAAMEVLRVEAGLPRFGCDYDFETLLPETGLEREAVSYSKGCYLGQETIARIKTYGTVQKALVGLLFDATESQPDSLPPAGTACLLDGKPVGTLQSHVFSPTLNRPIALAYLGKSERVPGKTLQLEIGGHTYTTEVVLLPFYDARLQYKPGTELLNEGLKLFSDGYDEEAMRLIQQAIERDSALVEAYEALGVILSRHERFQEAIAMMERVLELEPEHVLAHTNLSVFYMKLGDKEKAEEEKAKATMAAFSKKAKAAGLVFDAEAERRKKEQATLEKISMFREALSFSPEDPLGNFGLGSAYLELKRYDEAIEPFEKVLKAQPKHSVAYLSLGKAYEGADQPNKAQEVYQKGIEVAAAKGDLMPLKEMQAKLDNLTLKLQG